MRPSPKDIAILVVAAFLLVVAAKLVDGRRAMSDAAPPVFPVGGSTGDGPSGADLRRCRDMREAALDDRSCLDGWDANRREFFGLPSGNERPAPAEPSSPGKRPPLPDEEPSTVPTPGREE